MPHKNPIRSILGALCCICIIIPLILWFSLSLSSYIQQQRQLHTQGGARSATVLQRDQSHGGNYYRIGCTMGWRFRWWSLRRIPPHSGLRMHYFPEWAHGTRPKPMCGKRPFNQQNRQPQQRAQVAIILQGIMRGYTLGATHGSTTGLTMC